LRQRGLTKIAVVVEGDIEQKKTEPVAEKPIVDKPAPDSGEKRAAERTGQARGYQRNDYTNTTPPSHRWTNKAGILKRCTRINYKIGFGNAGYFKSTSGWNDGKYYALMNNVGVGNIER